MSENSVFMASINAFVEKAKADMEDVVKGGCFRILNRLILTSPVGNPSIWKINQTATAYNDAVSEHNAILRSDPANLTKSGSLKRGLKVHDSMDVKAPPNYTGGRFRGNWQVSFDQPADGILDRDEKSDPGGSVTLSEGVAVIEQFRVGTHAVYFVNNVEYSYPLEFGHSSQAPNGVLRLAAADAQRYFEEQAMRKK